MAVITALVPFANDASDQYGIHVTESEVIHLLTMFGITATAGVGASAHKKREE